MSAIAALPSTEASLAPPPIQLDAFQNATNPNPSNASPEAITKSVLSGLHAFSGHELAARTNTDQAIKASTTSTGTVDPASNPSNAGAGMSTREMLDRSSELQTKSLGIIMETYSFALEASLVTNAATTFTSSINTLIKTQ